MLAKKEEVTNLILFHLQFCVFCFIRALCNADLAKGIFKAGKDVSLPETTIRRPN